METDSQRQRERTVSVMLAKNRIKHQLAPHGMDFLAVSRSVQYNLEFTKIFKKKSCAAIVK